MIPLYNAARQTGTPAVRTRILVVEDQDDVRTLMATALRLSGYAVDEADRAHAGLNRLKETRYNLVLTDYAMPGGTGAWMLHEAARQGLMADTAALVVTAHPDVADLATGVDIISKPFDLDVFLTQVRGMVGAPDGERDEHAWHVDQHGGDPEPIRQTTGGGTYRVELVLYVSSASAASVQARRNLEQVLERFERSQIKCSVCDLVRDPLAGTDDRVAFTPTLVKRFPEPRMWVIGNFRDPEVVADLLRASGVDTRA
jgi:CheY-like chemotaxis protein